MEELPAYLKCHIGLACTGGHCQEDAFLSVCNGFEDIIYCVLLIVSRNTASVAIEGK